MMISVYILERAAAVEQARRLQEAQEHQDVRHVPPCMTMSSHSLLAEYQEVPRRVLCWFANEWTSFLQIWQRRLGHLQAVEHDVSHRQALRRPDHCRKSWSQPATSNEQGPSTLTSRETDRRTRMETHQQQATFKPRVGMTLAFTTSAEPALADISATVVTVWPPFRSGSRLITLEYATPVQVGPASIKQIEAFVSEVYAPDTAVDGQPIQAMAPASARLAHIILQDIAWARTKLGGSRHSVPRVRPQVVGNGGD